MERKEFLETIKACRRRLNMAEFFKLLVVALCVGAGVGILVQAVAFVIPFYYANFYTIGAFLMAVLTAFVMAYIRRCTMKKAALVMDSFGFQERIVTAYEHLNEDSAIMELQREDALKQLKAHRDKIRIPLLPAPKKLAGVAGLLLLVICMAFIPSEVKERAVQLHQIREEAIEKEKEIEEVVEELQELEQEALTPEQLAALQEMMESMQASLTEFKQAESTEMLATANEKLNYKYEDMGSQLESIAQSLQNGATVSAQTAESMQAMAEKLQEMSGSPSDENQSLASNQGQNGQSGNGQNGDGSGQNGQSGNGQNGDENGQNSQSGNGQNGDGSGQNGQSGNGQNGDGSGQNSQSGNGQNGDGSGQNGQSGNGQNGNGNGAGNGRGEGSSNATHDYVSIPNTISDEGSLTGNAQDHDNSEFYRTQNGLSWEGTHVSHEAVIGDYEQNAYEGIAAGKYPSGMEDVIKEYFSSFN